MLLDFEKQTRFCFRCFSCYLDIWQIGFPQKMQLPPRLTLTSSLLHSTQMIPPFYFHSLLHPRLLPLSNLLLTLPLFLLPGPCPLKDLWMLELQVLPEVTVKQRKGAETGLMPNLLPSGNIFPSPKRYPLSLPLLNLSQNLNSIANFSVSRFLGLF